MKIEKYVWSVGIGDWRALKIFLVNNRSVGKQVTYDKENDNLVKTKQG